MAYRFKHRETIPRNVKRIAAEELDSAIGLLKGRAGVSREDSIHEVRKSIKKTRALLRMVRPELGSFFEDENYRLRDIGRKLSGLRDASALTVAVSDLRRRTKAAALKKPLASARKVFDRQRRQLEEQADAQELFPTLAMELRKVRQSIRYWQLEADGFRAIADGMERTYRAGRKALKRAQRSGRLEDYHEWRKRVKDHWYQLRLLHKIWGDVMSGYEQSMKHLEDALGEDINLSLLERNVQQVPMSSLKRIVGSARHDLRQRAAECGARIYAEKPRAFTRRLKRLWKAW